jgi:hypothetical protein
MKDLKFLAVVMILLLGLISFATLVSATSDNYEIQGAYMDGVRLSVNQDTAISAELGDELQIQVDFDGEETGEYVDDVRFKAWIGGYEYGDIEATSGPFDVEPNVTYVKSVDLELPEDLEVCFYDNDENDDYEDCTFTLYVEVYDDDDSERAEYTFFLERPRHYVTVLDVIVENDVEAGELAKVEVRLENLGESKEEDIKVTLSIDELDVTESGYIDELAAPEEDNEDEESSDSIFLYLETPDDAVEGYYDLALDVSYDRGHESIEETHSIFIEGTEEVEEETETVEEEEEEVEDVDVSVLSSDVDAVVGERAAYTVTFTNPNEDSEVFTIDVLGEDQWGTVEVEPSVVLVKGNDVEEVTVYVTPNEAGDYIFTLQILDDEDNLVIEEDVELTATASNNGTATWLKVLFIVIVVIIIIIILVVAFRRSGSDDDDLDLDGKDGETYY